MGDHAEHEHNEQAMAEISNMVGQAIDQLCWLYGQCGYHTTLTIFKDEVEGIERACQLAEEHGDGQAKKAAARMRTETAEVLRGLANIIKAEGDYNVTATNH